MPAGWLRLRPPLKKTMTEQERNAAKGVGLGKPTEQEETEDDE